MTVSLWIIIILCTAQIIGIIFTNTVNRDHLTSMHGMIVSMTLGMVGGIFYGTIIGLILNGNLFVSTVISIVMGLSIGFLAGLPFGIVAVLDGSVSGLMGGMMGAMLGEMIPMANSDSMLKLLAFFTMMLFILISFLTQDTISEVKKKQRLFTVKHHPYVYIFAIAILFYFLKDIDIITIRNHEHH